MIGRADIEGSKSNVAMNAWLPRASYPCGNSSDTSCIKLVKSKGSIGHAFAVRIHTENQDQASLLAFCSTREAVHLGDLLRIWVRTGTKITLSPSIFKGQQRRTGHRKRRGAFREQRPYLRTSRFQGHDSYKKDNSSPGPPSTSPSSVALPHLVPKDLSPCPVGEY
ncbi:hypothetical protein JTE90_005432 [Oedothorax gibbosus]|uniref:Uncharacterized protein n=1 Tax=Oedothorax gibbosus TaxID=931172 RepID=A0AAV6TG24_9ARAC|nr:hypothetical protein JTE90_005432 [Oedothorax gibbosus]